MNDTFKPKNVKFHRMHQTNHFLFTELSELGLQKCAVTVSWL